MTKRIIALLLALILTVGLLPTVALADTGDEETTANPITNPESRTANRVTLSKTAAKNDDGTYTIRLEAYAHGSSTTTETTEEVPTDIILVLDRSGSMSEKMGAVKYSRYEGRETRNDNLYDNKDNLYYQLKDGSYVKVTVERKQEDIYTAYPGNTTNETYYNDSHDYGDPVTLYAQTTDGYKEVKVDREKKWVKDGYWRYRSFFTYTLTNNTKIASDIKGSDKVPTFDRNSVTSQVLYTKSRQNVYTYTYEDAAGQKQLITTSTGDSTELRNNPPMWYQWVDSDGGDSKMEALKNAASNFVDSVAKKAAGTGGKTVAHRIAVVSFASDAKNNTNGFKDMTKSGEVTSVKNTINNLKADGGTLVDKGIETANGIFKNDPIFATENRNRVMIVFTDGAPGSYGDWQSASVATANSAIIAAKASKDTYKATVFTIGIFAGAQNSLPIPDYTQYTFWGPYEVSPSDADQTKNSNRFMHLVSTNYPSATDIENPGEQNKNTGYYLTASDSASLNNVFQQISNQIQDVKTTSLDQNAVVKDVVGDSFTFTGTSSDVKVKTAAFDNIVDGQYKFETTEKDFTDARIDVDGKTITVTNFNFKEQWCGFDTNNGNQTKHGNKLIIEFKVGVGTTGSDSGQIPTNNGDASILDKAGDGATSVVSVASPTVKGYQVTYDPGVDGEAVTDMPSDSKYFITGTTVDEKEPKRAGYNFTGWKKSGDTTNTTYHGKDEITFDGDDVELIAQWTAKTISVDLKDFVEKQFTMTGLNELTNEEEFIVTVKQTKPETTTEQSYTGKVKFKEAGIKPFEFTSNPGLTYGNEYEFEVEETEGPTSGIAYDKTKHTLKLSVVTNNNGDLEVIGEKVTVKNSYTQTYTLTYDANGGIAPVPATSTGHKTGDNVPLNYTTDQPTHAQVSGDNVYLIGWSLTDTSERVYTRNERASLPMLANNVTFESSNITVYAVWAVDEDGNGTPDVYDAEATYRIVGGKWADNTTNDKIEYVSLYEKNATTGKWTEIANPTLTNIPSDMTPDENHKTPGAWDNNTTPAFAKSGTNVFTYTYPTKGKYSVTYTWNGLPEDGKFAAGTKPTLPTPNPAEVNEGDSHDVDTTYTSTSTVTDVDGNVYKFSGWSSATGGVVIDESGKINGIQTNVTLTGTWTKLGSGTFNLNTLIKKHFTKAAESAEIPNENFTFTATIESYPDKKHTYIGTVTMNGTENDKYFDFGDSQNLTLTPGTYKYRVTEELGTDTRISYDSRAYILTIRVADDGSYNVSVEQEDPAAQSLTTAAAVFPDNKQITFTNTYFEKKDPNALYLDFSKFVQKELTATGSKAASDVNFTVNVKESPIPLINSTQGVEAVSTYAGELLSTTLNAHFDSITGGETKTTPFTGSVEITSAGQYIFELREEDGQRTGVTYDETIYTLYVQVQEKEGSLAVTHWYFTDSNRVEHNAGEKAAFYNTIDTGKDDYYPIIIPTIINKDTGMLNKTDHFAYVIGYPDGTVHPNGQITRAEVATIFFRLLRDEVRDGAFTTSNTYSDVAYGKWYNNPISTMSALGIITGYPDGTFKPNKPITRAEFAAIAARFDETQSGKSATFSDVIGHWAAKEIGIAYYNDWIKGYPDGTFKPDQNITRAEAMTLINRVLERKPESPADLLTNMNKWTDNMDTSKWYYLDVQEATNSHGYTRKTFNYELWRQMLPDPDWSRYER